METVKCPVCDWEIKDAGIDVQAEGRQLPVCCDDCAARVWENPQAYV